MKLDPTVMRTMSANDFRLLEAVETGMKDHALVPLPLVTALANVRHGGTHKIVSGLLRDKLLSHERKNGHDGYRLTNAGYDILALHQCKVRGIVAALGHQIGTGKESDIYLAVDPAGHQLVLKFHRLGRTSFRNVRKKRDYVSKAAHVQQQAHSWLFLSRLSAVKEFSFLKALNHVGYPTPIPLGHNRHIVAMSLVRGMPLYQIFPHQLSVAQAASMYTQSVALATRLARHGLVHCDLNEFNLLVDLSGIQRLATTSDDPYVRHSGQSVAASVEQKMGALSLPAWEQSLEVDDAIPQYEPQERLSNGDPKPIVVLIDFPQMISIEHPNAQEYYERDLACLRRFFEGKLQCTIPEDEYLGIGSTAWDDVVAREVDCEESDKHINDPEHTSSIRRLDAELRASGSSASGVAGYPDLELYYFQREPDQGLSAVDESGQDEVLDEYGEEDDGDNSQASDGDSNEEEGSDKKKSSSIEGGEGDDAASQEGGQSNDGPYNSSIKVDMPKELTLDVDKEFEECIRMRVKKQLSEQKRKDRSRQAFRKGNSNKKYVKGKRLHPETVF
jgi:RIO kinase 2